MYICTYKIKNLNKLLFLRTVSKNKVEICGRVEILMLMTPVYRFIVA